MTKLKIKRGDNVIITTGRKEIKGKKGEVIEVIRKEGKDARVIVAGLNIPSTKDFGLAESELVV